MSENSPQNNLREELSRRLKNSEVLKVSQIQIKISPLNLLKWLEKQKHDTKLYWADRDNELQVAGIGVAHKVSLTENFSFASLYQTTQKILSNSSPEVRFYGGTRFHPQQSPDDLWSDFGAAYFIIPRLEIRQTNSDTYFCLNYYQDSSTSLDRLKSSLEKDIAACCFSEANDTNIIQINSKHNTPGEEEWDKIIECALDKIHCGDLSKIVLARRQRTLTSSLNQESLMSQLDKAHPNTFRFYLKPNSDKAFLVATPERLMKKVDNQLWSEAIAGTRPRTSDQDTDAKLAQELMDSQKDRNEHQFVINNLEEAISPLAEDSKIETTKVLKLSTLQHLWTPFKAKLKKGISEDQILDILHPTSAVCGTPKEKAWDWIRDLEKFDRGWYAGPVGYIGYKQSEFVVAIRSALACQQEIYLFAGAGIVSESQAKAEWEEISHKIGSFEQIWKEK